MTLAIQMEALLVDVRELIRKPGAEHWWICQEVAGKWDLWDKDDCFPVWLSRIVEGEIADQ